MIDICVVGGGTGTIPVLTALKTNEKFSISIVVTMTDDGGSNAVMRDEFGLLPISDLRKSIIALSRGKNGVLRDLFTYRFSRGGGLAGHTLGNLIITALSDITGSEIGAIEAAKKLFNVRGKIIPVTLDQVKLTAEYENGDIVQGEHLIDETKIYKNSKIKRLFLSPKAKANKEAQKAIENADFIIAGPGDLYTSTLANVVVEGITESIEKSEAKFIFISNLMTKAGQTRGMKSMDIVEEIALYCKRLPDYVIVNNSIFPSSVIERYDRKGEKPIENNIEENEKRFQLIYEDVLADEVIEKSEGDKLTRSLLRHDSKKLKKILEEIINL